MSNLPIDWPIVVAIIIGAIVLRLLKGRGKAPSKVCGYRRFDALLSPAELSFLQVLQLAVGDRYAVFAKVRVADVLKPDRRQEKQELRASLDRISSKHFDFVLCEPASCAIHAVIELHDSSHEEDTRSERHAFLREACESAGLRLIEVEARSSYDVAKVRAMVLEPAVAVTTAGEPPLGPQEGPAVGRP